MKKLLHTLLILLIVYFSFYLLTKTFILESYGIVVKSEDKKIIVHRGFGKYAPDNSLSGAKAAMREGFEWLDIDSQLSKDGELVVFHDLYLNNKTNSRGKVFEWKSDDLYLLDLSEKFQSNDDGKWVGSYIVSLDEYIGSFASPTKIIVELKDYDLWGSGIEKKVIEIIKKNNAIDRVYVNSFNPFVLLRVRKIDPNIKIFYSISDKGQDTGLYKNMDTHNGFSLSSWVQNPYVRNFLINSIKPEALCINYLVSQEVINKYVLSGYPVILFTVDSKEKMRQLKNERIFGIVTNEPYLLRDVFLR